MRRRDATPLFLTEMLDYVRTSGDVAFLKAHAAEVERAWRFETTHDSDGDGILDNSEGTGWVESWPPGMPKQEVYLALLDRQASSAMAELAPLLGDAALGRAAGERGARIAKTIEQEYYLPATKSYAFSRNTGGEAGWDEDDLSGDCLVERRRWFAGGEGLARALGFA